MSDTETTSPVPTEALDDMTRQVLGILNDREARSLGANLPGDGSDGAESDTGSTTATGAEASEGVDGSQSEGDGGAEVADASVPTTTPDPPAAPSTSTSDADGSDTSAPDPDAAPLEAPHTPAGAASDDPTPATTPDTATAPDPLDDPAGTDDAGDADSTPEAPATDAGGYLWTEGDQSHHFSDDEVRQGLNVLAWAKELPDEVQHAFGAIEAGQAIAISRQEYEQYAEWRAEQEAEQQASTRIGELGNLDLDMEQEAAFRKLLAENERLRAGTGAGVDPAGVPGTAIPQPGTAPQPTATAIDENLDQTLTSVQSAANDFATLYNLSPEQMDAITMATVEAEIVPWLADRAVQRNPVTGAVVGPGNLHEVFTEAFRIVTAQNPHLLQPAAGTATPSTSPSTSNPSVAGNPSQPVAAPNVPDGADPTVTSKKARSASLASAPAADVMPTSKPVGQLNHAELVQEMTAFIAQSTGDSN